MPGEITPGPIALFYSYSHKDESLRDELAKHLTTLQRAGFIREWYDREIRAGVEARRQPQPCSVPGCGQVGRLYACGYRCPDHAP